MLGETRRYSSILYQRRDLTALSVDTKTPRNLMAPSSLLSLGTHLKLHLFASCGEGSSCRWPHLTLPACSKAQGCLCDGSIPLQGLTRFPPCWPEGCEDRKKKNTIGLTFISISDFWFLNLVKILGLERDFPYHNMLSPQSK